HNAGNVRVSAPGDYATFNSNHTPDGTLPVVDAQKGVVGKGETDAGGGELAGQPANPLSRGEVVSKIWEYIRSHNLQNPENRREILADDKLTKVFGTDKVTMFEMNKHLARHLK